MVGIGLSETPISTENFNKLLQPYELGKVNMPVAFATSSMTLMP